MLLKMHLTNKSYIKFFGYKSYHVPHPQNQAKGGRSHQQNQAKGGSALLVKQEIHQWEEYHIQTPKVQFTRND